MRSAVLRIVIVIGSALALVVAGASMPLLFRRWHAFDVRRVEVIGARHLDAREAVEAAGIREDASVFSNDSAWLHGLLEHPLVADAHIERRVPNTVVLHITESTPVALARTPELRPIDARGRILPVHPAAYGLDVPVLTTRTRVSDAGRAADEETLRVVAFLERLARDEPGLLGWVSEAGTLGGDIRLVLRTARSAEVLLPVDATPKRLRELHYTLAELANGSTGTTGDTTAARRRAADAELSRVRRIDVRFHDQIIVAHGGKN